MVVQRIGLPFLFLGAASCMQLRTGSAGQDFQGLAPGSDQGATDTTWGTCSSRRFGPTRPLTNFSTLDTKIELVCALYVYRNFNIVTGLKLKYCDGSFSDLVGNEGIPSRRCIHETTESDPFKIILVNADVAIRGLHTKTESQGFKVCGNLGGRYADLDGGSNEGLVGINGEVNPDDQVMLAVTFSYFCATPPPTPTPTTPAPPTPAPTPVPPTPAPPCVGATCTVMEDPHVTVFDGGAVSMLQSLTAARGDRVAADEKWLVKSSLVSIQARYTTDDTKANGSLFVRAVAVSGDFLKGNTLIIGSLQDSITWNGNEILEDAQSSFSVSEGDFFVNATRGEHSRHVEDLIKEGRGVSVELPLGVALTVNRLHAHVNVAITMPPQDGGQDGLCGNFNGITSDDSFELTNQRSQIDVSLEDSLFANVMT